MTLTWRRAAAATVAASAVSLLPLTPTTAHVQSALPGLPVAAQPLPHHQSLVPDVPRTNTPKISSGEIWDLEVVGNRVFIAGSFTTIANKTGTTTPITQRYLAAYDYTTGRVDTTFRPTFDGSVQAVEASPDGTKLFVGGTFHNVNGVPREKVARLSLTTGAPAGAFAFTGTTNNAVSALEATNTTVYIGGRFTRVDGVSRTGLVAANATTGAIDMQFDNQLSGGIGVGGTLTVQQLKLTHNERKLLVVHTGRKIDGQDRLGVGLINTVTKELLPWRTRLWDQYLDAVGGIQRIYAGDIAPDDSYFVVSSGSGGDRPPISDTAIAFPIAGQDFVEPLWVARCFDSVYSVAISETAVYIGGHFQWNESPTANQPWPGLDNVGYGTGQGLSGYGLGDQVVRRDHLGALDPETGTALEWNPGSNSFEGNKAMLATKRGLFVGGDGNIQGGVDTGRVAFYDFATVPPPAKPDTTIKAPIEGRVVPSGTEFVATGRALTKNGVDRVNLRVRRSGTSLYLQDDLTTWGASNTIQPSLGPERNGKRKWSIALTLTGTREYELTAATVADSGAQDATPARKTMETFNFDDQTPSTSITGPSSPLASTTFTVQGPASDDHGISELRYWFRDENGRYLQDDGSVDAIYNTFRGLPDIVGATSATWSYEVTLPHDGTWRGSATAIDNAGQSDLRSSTRDWLISPGAASPVIALNQPTTVTPPTTGSWTVEPGAPLTFSGVAVDPDGIRNVEVYLRNSSTREVIASDGSWGTDVVGGFHRISAIDVPGTTYQWSYTTPFNFSPGVYTFYARATDDIGLTNGSSSRVSLTVSAQYAGDAFPDTLLDSPGTGQPSLPNSSLPLSGTATDDQGVSDVRLLIYDNDSGRYLQPNGTLDNSFATVPAVVTTPGSTSTTWTYSGALPGAGDYSVTAIAADTNNQWDPSSTGATGRYRYFPGDSPPEFVTGLGQPVDGSVFDNARIAVSGRAEDDISIAKVETAIVDGLGRYMDSSGKFLGTTPSWRTAFLNSPGSPGSNFSYTSPVLPAGTYTVLTRPIDHHDQIGAVRTATDVVVNVPTNSPPVAAATFSCAQNVCTFDGRGSTDENPTALTYAWSFGGAGSATGPTPVKTFTAPSTYTVTLTIKDEWGATASTVVNVPISTPAGNVAPTPNIAVSCLGLWCAVNGASTQDANTGDVITYAWDWGDGSATSTTQNTSHTYAAGNTYTIQLTATDGWGASNTTSTQVTVSGP
ncbi:MAG TPA: PKD domain-containing protein [Actinomycetes bacterium]|nr:PKD domain-containing protein [Actinomycetes bacterium]